MIKVECAVRPTFCLSIGLPIGRLHHFGPTFSRSVNGRFVTMTFGSFACLAWVRQLFDVLKGGWEWKADEQSECLPRGHFAMNPLNILSRWALESCLLRYASTEAVKPW